MRYSHPTLPGQKFYFTFLYTGDSKVEVSAASSAKEDQVYSYELKVD
jgi:hypothetical protein